MMYERRMIESVGMRGDLAMDHAARLLAAIATLATLQLSTGDLEPTFQRCCTLGSNWASEGLKCSQFPAPVTGIPAEHQGICLSSVEICCIRTHRETMCENGKEAAEEGKDCVVDKKVGGEFQKDCCEACKLGLISGSMGHSCSFATFKFGAPWDSAHHSCCLKTAPSTTSMASSTFTSTSASTSTSTLSDTAGIPTPALDSLCDLLPGELCAHICIPVPDSYRCECRPGFSLMEDNKSCHLNDEAADRCAVNNPCSQKCVDTGIAVECSCHSGFILAADKRTCNDIDECKARLHACDPGNQVCVNEPGSYSCTNKDGSKSKPHSRLDNRLKGEDQAGGKCPPGYQFNAESQVCDDVDECQLNVDGCGANNICQNTIGSFTCARAPVEDCPPGFLYNNVQKTCRDINECAEAIDNCNREKQYCLNTEGGFTCQDKTEKSQCPAGFKFNKNVGSCEDVDECVEELHGCTAQLEVCRNTEGAYECDTHCEPGWEYSVGLRSCVDVNECERSPQACKKSELCVNTVGSFQCTRRPAVVCPAGYKPSTVPSQKTCQDVDECAENIDSCERRTEVCVNEVGSYRCDAVAPTSPPIHRYTAVQTPTTTLRQTLLTSPNLRTPSLRHPIASTSPPVSRVPVLSTSPSVSRVPVVPTTPPTLHYIGNVQSESAKELQCPRGYSYNPHANTCLDINECAAGLHNCSAQREECVNTPGSFVCRQHPTCATGFRFSSVTQRCDDVDECLEAAFNCRPEEICVNAIGSYRCSITCRSGYRKKQSANGEECVDVDECAEQTDSCNKQHEICRNNAGGYACEQCPQGFRKITHDSCGDINECAENLHNCRPNENCMNVNGSYSCVEREVVCGHGYRHNATANACQDVDECLENSHNCNPVSQQCSNVVGGFHCLAKQSRPSAPQCPAGYRPDAHYRSCIDVNECSEGTSTCAGDETCVNTRGSYTCTPAESGAQVAPNVTQPQSENCPAGFRYNRRRVRCFDINECEEGIHICNLESEACINEPGGYRCGPKVADGAPPPPNPCQPGFKPYGSQRGCVDVDECAAFDPPCDSNQLCVNTPGSYTCSCKVGYILDHLTRACVDINECQVNQHDCLPSQRCDNTIGSFHCIRFTSCGTGYTLNSQSGLCEDDDECVLQTDNCRFLGPVFQCRNTAGSFRCERKRCVGTQKLNALGVCVGADGVAHPPPVPAVTTRPVTTTAITCPPGYRVENGQCIDVNECEVPTACRRNQRCVNTGGSYRCINFINCNGGYELNEAGTHCVDIDECAGRHECGRGQQCINRPGGYVCQCPSGHTVNQANECVDIDECTKYAGQVCSSHSVCRNTPGSYACQCKAGFKQGKEAHICEDVDECKEAANLCQHSCINMWGSYYCTCQPGFTLSTDNRTCTDVNECDMFRDRQLCIGNCVNQPGSYSCSCPDGYRLGNDGRTCQDVDECQGGSVCPNPNEICFNTRGSYRCNTITCPPNFIKDTEHKNRCKRASLFCRDNDQACLRMPLSYSYNYITFVSNLAIPPATHLDLFTMRGPLWQTTNARFNLELLDTRTPNAIRKVNKNFFRLRNTAPNQAVISLAESIQGPQEIELQLTMDIYRSGEFGGSAVAKLFIYVSQYDY